MDGVEETVEDWWDLVQQVRKRTEYLDEDVVQVVGAVLLLARELKFYRQWAEEHHST